MYYGLLWTGPLQGLYGYSVVMVPCDLRRTGTSYHRPFFVTGWEAGGLGAPARTGTEHYLSSVRPSHPKGGRRTDDSYRVGTECYARLPDEVIMIFARLKLSENVLRVRILDLDNAWAWATSLPWIITVHTSIECIVLKHYPWKRPAGKHPTSGDFVSFTTIRKLRSAASTFFEWDIQQANPGRAIREHGSRRPLIASDCSPTDTLQYYALMSIGMGKRLGWLCWLWGGEIFGLERSDIKVISPRRGGQFDLTPQVRMILLQLDPATKASQTRQADMVIAYLTWSGIPYGLWVRRLFWAMDDLGWSEGPLFRHVTTGILWNSAHYRHTFLCPVLRWLKDNGMISLRRFDDSPGMTVENWFYSMVFLRRGGRSEVSCDRPHTLRATTNDEVHEHGRWRNKGKVDRQMSHHYCEWPYKDQITITWLCQ
eukprot:scaffold145110_cov58-Attheya_sp.AAC.1